MKIISETGSHFDLQEERASALLNDVLAKPLFAHLATASDRGPRGSPVWFLWEGEELWIIGNSITDTFPKRIRKDARCAVGIVDFDVASGLVHHVGMRGVATIERHDRDRIERLLSRYMGHRSQWDPRFIPILDDAAYIFVRITPETVVVRDQSYER